MNCKNLEISRKTTKIYEIHFTKNSRAQDITGWKIYFVAKEKMDDPDTGAPIYKEVSPTNPKQGIAQIELSTTDTDVACKNYNYSIDYLDVDGNEGILFWGKLKIAKRVRD